mmetsp:Transcript_35624/g.83327  ORF Transcript_35624/g.83327 Transcript_35624/m.83327 type:complete len:458 (+) Transcript_35624:119-1492(+)
MSMVKQVGTALVAVAGTLLIVSFSPMRGAATPSAAKIGKLKPIKGDQITKEIKAGLAVALAETKAGLATAVADAKAELASAVEDAKRPCGPAVEAAAATGAAAGHGRRRRGVPAGTEDSAASVLDPEPRPGGSMCQHRETCRWNFVRYIPSKLEETWWQGVDDFGAPGKDVCKAANSALFSKWFDAYAQACPNSAMMVSDKGPWPMCDCKKSEVNASKIFDPEIFSRFEYVNECTKEVRYSFIEPLAGILRHPACCKDLGNNFLRKDWLVVDQWSIHRNNHLESKYYYFDAGASTWTTGSGGASQSWFDATYRNKCVKFDGFWMWEVTAHDAKEVFRQVPAEAAPVYHWFNAPAEIDATEKMSPLFHMKSVAREDDFVMFKLDIDNTFVEEGIVNNILQDKQLHGLIDEFFWEHHINMVPMTQYWGLTKEGAPAGHRKSIGIFRQLRQYGIRAHSWV